jgi:hypothetical protein
MANSKWALIQSDNETQGLTRPASRPHLDRIGEPMLVVALQEGKSIMKDFRFSKKKHVTQNDLLRTALSS